MNKIVTLLLLVVVLAFPLFAEEELDTFFSMLPKDVQVKEVQCSIAGKPVAPLKLDSFHFYKDSLGTWNVKLTVHTTSAVRKITPEEGHYTLSVLSEGKRLDIDFDRGPDMSLVYSNNAVALVEFYALPQLSGENFIRQCIYR